MKSLTCSTHYLFQFFHEAKEYGQWMPAELNKHVQNLEGMSPDENDDAALLKMLKELLAVFLHWQNKINVLFDKSRKIVPVHYRTKPLDHYVPVTSLCDYKTNEVLHVYMIVFVYCMSHE